MKTSWKKSIKDLTSYPKKAVLVIFALSLGIWGVGSVLISYVILSNDLNRNYQSTLPAHVIFNSTDFSALTIAQLKKDPRIAAAEFRDFALERIEIKPDVWIPLWLYGVDNFKNIPLAKLFPKQGNSIPIQGTILIERDGLKVSNIAIDSMPRVRIGNKILRVPVSGICFDPGQAPATQDAFIYAYTDKTTFAEITGVPINHRLIIRLNHVYSKEQVASISNLLAFEMKKEGIVLQSVEMPPFNQHPHQWQLNTLLFIIGTIGLLAFIMGAVLVSQLIRSIMSSQIRQIGILKSIGATRFQILRMYLFMLFAIGMVSGIVAIPLAVKTGYAFSYFVAGIINFEILSLTLPAYIYIYLVVASILLPIVLSLPMLLRGTATSVKNALSDYGISQQMSGYPFPFLKLKWLSYTMQLAVKNTMRNRGRFLVTIATMALGVAIFNTGFNVRQSLWLLLSGLKNEMQYDVQVALNQPIPRDQALLPFKGLKNVKQVEMWVGGKGEIQSKVVSANNGAGIVALPRNSKLLQLKIKEGRWLQESPDLEVVLNQQALALYKNPAVGTAINISVGNKNVLVKVVGITEQFEKPKIYMDIKKYDSLFNPQHYVNTLVFVAQNIDFDKVVALKKNIENKIASSDLNVLYVMSQAERVKIIYDHLNIILSVIVILSFLVLLVSAVGMASATGINIWERTREIGIFRSIGATPKMIYKLFVTEGMIISVASIILGTLLAIPLSKIAAVFFGNLMLGEGARLQYAFSPLGFIITIVVTLLFGFLASRLPAKSAVALSTSKALAYE